MCFVRRWNLGFFTNLITSWLSAQIVISTLFYRVNFSSNSRNQIPFMTAFFCAIYFISVINNITEIYFRNVQLITPPAKKKIQSLINLKLFKSPAQSESIYFINTKTCLSYTISYFFYLVKISKYFFQRRLVRVIRTYSVLTNLEYCEDDIQLRLIYNVYNRAEYRLKGDNIFL